MPGLTNVTQRRTVPALTGIRFIAAVYVFIFHFGASAIDVAGAPRPISTLLHNGFFGVSAFFVLSGFILAHAYPMPFSSFSQYTNYGISRLARIYPTYLFALIIGLPLVIDSLKPLGAASVLSMVQSWGSPVHDYGYAWIMQAWTLSVEVAFYVSFPFVITLIRKLNLRVLISLFVVDAAFLIACAVSIIRPGIIPGGSPDMTGSHDVPIWLVYIPLPLTRSSEFFLGVLSHCIVRDLPIQFMGKGHIWLYVLAGLIVILLSSSTNGHLVSFVAVMFAVLLALIYVSKENAFTNFLGSSSLVVLGSASYALYLLQGPLHAYALTFAVSPYGRILALPISVVISVMVWRLVEAPSRSYIMTMRRQRAGSSCG